MCEWLRKENKNIIIIKIAKKLAYSKLNDVSPLYNVIRPGLGF